ncbi:DUF881 domain-containing protein [Nocardioides sp. R-C-SC26]|uniref:DUF881 domain-containing protein n=1 Tax=Nocardioides sp. R-C-SC26 TaxID=2870414 RepID=UPI001E452D10|nr:DUF881 domain-containing protein [Nocardioides sp. R-C-SC26]
MSSEADRDELRTDTELVTDGPEEVDLSDRHLPAGRPDEHGADDKVPARVRMPLLTLITQQSLDQDYLDAAERRAAGAPRAPIGRPPRVAAVVIAIFGLMVSIAFVQTSRNADVATASRDTLIRRIEAQRDRVARQQERVAALRDRNISLQRSVTRLTGEEQAAQVRNRRLQTRTGFVAVTGPGVRVLIEQVEDADLNQQIRDSDLTLVVNGLWQAGAEAISVNGLRMTAQSGISATGTAILVNKVGVAPPFTIEAIGDTRTLAARFFDTTTGLAFADVARDYGMTYSVDNVERLSLPAAPATYLRLGSAQVYVPGEKRPGPDREEPFIS